MINVSARSNSRTQIHAYNKCVIYSGCGHQKTQNWLLVVTSGPLKNIFCSPSPPNKIQGLSLNSQQRNRLSRENDPMQSWRAVFLEGEQLTSARLTFPIFSLRWAKIYLGVLHGRGDSITATEEMVKAVGTEEEKWKYVSKQKLKKA